MPGSGNITREATVWCGYCEEWHQDTGYKMHWFQKVIKSLGWKKIEGRWVCPKCRVKDDTQGPVDCEGDKIDIRALGDQE